MNKRPKIAINGFINLYKPLNITSSDAVNKVKWLLKPTKIGHAGTLDPLATGVLPLALGEGTKCINLLMDAKKIYEFAVTFGERRSTDDAEGEVVATSDNIPTAEKIKSIIPHFTGEISQTPPIYSALKVDGKRAYDLARAGEAVELQPRKVTIHSLEFLGFEVAHGTPSPLAGESNSSSSSVGGQSVQDTPPGFARANPAHPQGVGRESVAPSPLTTHHSRLTSNSAHFRATVSKGTYIRSLGRDIAQKLGSEGYISRLHRAAVGPFTDKDAISLDFLGETAHNAGANELPFVLPLHAALDDIPALALSAQQLATLRHGQQVSLAKPHPDTPLLGAMFEGQLVGLVRVERDQVITVRLLNSC